MNATLNAGDYVRLTNGATKLEGYLRPSSIPANPGGYGFCLVFNELGGDSDYYLDAYESHGFTVELLPAPLPTDPGVYTDKAGDFWVVEGDGHLSFLATLFGTTFKSEPDELENLKERATIYAPFTKVPLS